MTHPDTEIGGPRRSFRSTLWTMVLKAQDVSSPDRKQALESLIQSYWKPLYLFVRRKGSDPETAKDLIQSFFSALLEKNYLKYVERGRGKFRTFLLTALEHFMADEFDKDKAQKRGGGKLQVPMDFSLAECQVVRGGSTPDQNFARDWALRVMAQGLEDLKAEFKAEGREAEFDALRHHLTEGTRGAPTYEEIGRTLGTTENDVRKRIYRARQAYREAILGVIRSYSETEEDAQEELRDLFSAFS